MHDGKRFEWDPTDYRSAPNELVIYGDYEPIKILLTIAKRSRTILDVGANAGWYSISFGQERRSQPWSMLSNRWKVHLNALHTT